MIKSAMRPFCQTRDLFECAARIRVEPFLKQKDRHTEQSQLTRATAQKIDVLLHTITNIDKRIDFETKRLETYRQRLVERYARLETTLGTLNSQSKALESAIAQLPNSNSK